MKSIRIACLTFFFAVMLTPAFSQASTTSDEQGVRHALSLYENALNAADTATIADLYTQDGVQMAPDQPAAVGREGVKAAYEATFKAISLKLQFHVDEVKLLGKTTALLRSHSTGSVKINGTDQPEGPAAFKELFILTKQANGKWKFSYYSFSTAPVASK